MIPFFGFERHEIVNDIANTFYRVQASTQPEVLMLVGMAGWGKTRIIQEFYRRIAYEQRQIPPYWPRELFDSSNYGLDIDFSILSELRRRVRHVAGFTVKPGAKIPWLWLAPTIRSATGGGSSMVVEELYAELLTHMGLLLSRAKAVHESVGSLSQLVTALMPLPDLVSLVASGSDTLQSIKTLIKAQLKVQGNQTRTVDRVFNTQQRAEEIGRLIRQIACGGPGFEPLPIILVLDDADGLDDVATELITALIGTHIPLLVIATTLPERFPLDAPFCKYVRDSSSSNISIRNLSPLSESDLVDMVLGMAPKTSILIAKALARRAGENPYALMLLLTSEVVRLATKESAINLELTEVDALPSSIEKLLDEHWESLSLEKRILLGAAALIGETLLEGPLSSALSHLSSQATIAKHADPLWICRLPDNEDILEFLEHIRYELALSKSSRLFTKRHRQAILQKASDVVNKELQTSENAKRRLLLFIQHDLSLRGAQVDKWELIKGALELAEIARSNGRNDKSAEMLLQYLDKLEPSTVNQARLAIECLNTFAAVSRLSGKTRKSTQLYAFLAVDLACKWLPEDDDLLLLALATKARSLRRVSSPQEFKEAEEICGYLRSQIDSSSSRSPEVYRSIQGLEVIIEMSRGCYARAAELAVDWVKLCEKNFGRNARQTTSALSDLGYALHRSDISRAVSVRFERLSRLSERLGDSNHLAVAPAKSDLAVSLIERGQPRDTDLAIQLIDEALEVRIAVLGSNNIKTQTTRTAMVRARLRKAFEMENAGQIEHAESLALALIPESTELYNLRLDSEKAGTLSLAHQRHGEVLAMCRIVSSIDYLEKALKMRLFDLHGHYDSYSVRSCARSLRWALDRLGKQGAAKTIEMKYQFTADELIRPGF